MIGDRTEQKAMMIFREPRIAADAQQGVVVEFRVCSDRASEFKPLRPLDLDRGNGQKQRSGEIAFAADAGLRDGFLGRDVGEPLRKIGR